MKKYFGIALLFGTLNSLSVNAQVGMMSNSPDKSAVLDMKATNNKGVLIPNVNLNSTTDVTGIAGGAPAQGLLVFNANTSISGTGAAGTGYYYWDTNNWKKLITDLQNVTGTASVISPNATIKVSGANTVLGATTLDINPGDNNTVITTNGSGVVTWVPAASYIDTALVAGNNISIVRNISGNTISATGDNLGNHTATQDLNMAGKNINNAAKTSTQTAAIAKGTDGNTPAAGNIATAADASGNIIWTPLTQAPGAISNVFNYTGTTSVVVTAGVQKTIIPVASFSLSKLSTLLITYSGLGLPSASNAPVQGTIDLYLDGNKVTSSFYTGADAPNGLLWGLSNYSTAQNVVQNIPAGTHTVELRARCWFNSTTFNTNPYPGYTGSQPSDTQALASRMTVIAFNQ